MTDTHPHTTPATRQRSACITAGGTGGHIFPGLAVAEALRAQGWAVTWLGGPNSMESRIVPERGIPFTAIDFGGVRGKGMGTLLKMPLRLLRAMRASKAALQAARPDVVIGMGGYISAPVGMAAAWAGIPLLLHEQNSVAGMANRLLAKVARRVFTAFPDVLAATATAEHAQCGKVQWIGNPLRSEFLQQSPPAERFSQRSGPLKLLVVGGSLGAQALNTVVPQALALLEATYRPLVAHQSGAKHLDALRAAYDAAEVDASLLAFIDEAAQAYAEADIIVCRAGASTVSELAAVGAAAVFVPFPHAVDDHQTTNARYLVDAGGGWLQPQDQLTPQWLANFLQTVTRAELQHRADKAHQLQKRHATDTIVAACEELAA